jgi:hypothetical protein
MTERSWVQTPTMETIFQAPFIWIKALSKNCGKTLTWHCCMCCNPANGRVDFEEWSAYKIQLHGIEWIVSLSADWDQKKSYLINQPTLLLTGNCYFAYKIKMLYIFIVICLCISLVPVWTKQRVIKYVIFVSIIFFLQFHKPCSSFKLILALVKLRRKFCSSTHNFKFKWPNLT